MTETKHPEIKTMTQRRWIGKHADMEAVDNLSKELGLHPVVSRVLVTRDCERLENARDFISSENAPLPNPYLMFGVEKAVKRIEQAIARGERILIVGDYDVDGLTASTILVKALRARGATPDYHIPSRMNEGYGLSETAVLAGAQEGVTLIITVDTGITAVEQVELAKRHGIDVVISDHHSIGSTIPAACCVVHPAYPRNHYSTPHLCGAGVAFKLAQALLGRVPVELLEMVALGTIADQVALTGENRTLVQMGLSRINHGASIGVSALLHVSGLENKRISSEDVMFQIAPRINAVGRLTESAKTVVGLFLTEDPEEALSISGKMNSLNYFRKKIQSKMELEAIEQIESHSEWTNKRSICVAKEGWMEGLVGILAGKIAERYYKPTLCIAINENIAKGSGRTIPDFNLYQALSTVQTTAGVLTKWGGHAAAVGFTLNSDDISQLQSSFWESADSQWTKDMLGPHYVADSPLELEDISFLLTDHLRKLEPWGQGNPEPIFFVRNAVIYSSEAMGSDGQHLKVTLKDKIGRLYNMVAFGRGDEVGQWHSGDSKHLLVRVKENIVGVHRRLQLHLVDSREV